METKINCKVVTHPTFVILEMLLLVGVRGQGPGSSPTPTEPDDCDFEFYECMSNCTHIYQNYELCLTKCATFDPPAPSPGPSSGPAPTPSSSEPAPVPSPSGPAPVPSPAGPCQGVVEAMDGCIHGCYKGNSCNGKMFVDACMKACRNEGFKVCVTQCKEGCRKWNIKCRIGCVPKCGYCISHF